jgi:[ribosomal protein S18]-alanine N-acetyltransferase
MGGYICFWHVVDEIQILNIAVSPDFRRRGIGRLLLEHGLRWGRERKARMAYLEVRESNTAARRLYESIGFSVCGERANYYGRQKESAILMALELSE